MDSLTLGKSHHLSRLQFPYWYEYVKGEVLPALKRHDPSIRLTQDLTRFSASGTEEAGKSPSPAVG